MPSSSTESNAINLHPILRSVLTWTQWRMTKAVPSQVRMSAGRPSRMMLTLSAFFIKFNQASNLSNHIQLRFKSLLTEDMTAMATKTTANLSIKSTYKSSSC